MKRPRILTLLLLLGVVVVEGSAAQEPPRPVSLRARLTPELLKAEMFLFTPQGFEREGQPKWVKGEPSGRVQIAVRDASTGRPTACRINVVGPDGNYYQPEANRLSRFALTGEWPAPGVYGNRPGTGPYRYIGRFFYSTGETTVAVPPGNVRVEVWKGLNFEPVVKSVQVAVGASHPVELAVKEAVLSDTLGYYSGDLHLHFPRENDEDDRNLFDLLEAEGVRYAFILAPNRPAGPYAGIMDKLAVPQRQGLGEKSIRRRGGFHLMSGQEYRTENYGHMKILMLDELVFPGQSFNAENGPVYGEIGRQAMAQGGFTIQAHGGYGQEIYADAALGTMSAVELLQFGTYRGIKLEDWYHILNTGYRFAAEGSSDLPACRMLSDSRTYVHHASAPTVREWLTGMAAGRSFVSNAPILLLEVDGEKPGAQIRVNGTQPRTMKVRVRVRCEVTPVTNIDLVVNGRVVEGRSFAREDGQGRWLEFAADVPVAESSWIAARAYSTSTVGQYDADAHTNPVYVYFNNRAPYQRTSLDTWVARIDAEKERHAKRNFPERAKVLEYHEQAKRMLSAIRQANGLAADAAPAKLAAQLTMERK